MYIIYRAINTVNGKAYIGLTGVSLEARKRKHFENARCPANFKDKKQALYLAIRKYGEEKFIWQELCCALSKEDAIELERDFISQYNTYEEGYNCTLGGEGVDNPRKLEKYVVRFPDQTVRVVEGYKKFCREHGLNEGSLWCTLNPYKQICRVKDKHYTYFRKNAHHKGYALLGKFNDYPGTEYILNEDGSGRQAEEA